VAVGLLAVGPATSDISITEMLINNCIS